VAPPEDLACSSNVLVLEPLLLIELLLLFNTTVWLKLPSLLRLRHAGTAFVTVVVVVVLTAVGIDASASKGKGDADAAGTVAVVRLIVVPLLSGGRGSTETLVATIILPTKTTLTDSSTLPR